MIGQSVLMMGAPGSGKGTQTALLGRRCGYVEVSAGDAARVAAAEKSPLGRVVARRMAAGELLPDTIVVDLLRDRLERLVGSDIGFILDGFPRTIAQLAYLERLVPRHELGVVIVLDAPRDVLVRRLRARGRGDDTDDVVLERLRVYAHETLPVVEELCRRGQVIVIDAARDPERVHRDIAASLGCGVRNPSDLTRSARQRELVPARGGTGFPFLRRPKGTSRRPIRCGSD